MGLWVATGAIRALSRWRIPETLMDATVMTDGQETQAVALPPSPIKRALDLIFFAKFASNPPSTVDYQLQIALNNIDAEFFTIGSTMTNSETVGGQVIVPDVVARFARVIANDADTVAVTIAIMGM